MRKRQGLGKVVFAIGVAGRVQRLGERLPDGQQALEYLKSAEAIAQMREAIEAGRPPVVAISAELLKRHRQLLNLPAGRRFIGQAIRVVLEANGYEPERSGVYISGDPVFTVGTTYCAVHQAKTAENRLLKHILDALPEKEARWAHDYLGRRLARR